MARRRDPERFDQLVEAAIRAFVANGGFSRTSIDDVARELGVAKGTVYLYVQSKEALFDLCLRRADATEPMPEPPLPVPAPQDGATLAYVRELLGNRALFGPLDAILAADEPSTPVRDELTRLCDELYRVLAEHRATIRLINASARDLPELGELWYGTARGGLNRKLASYLSRRTMSGHLRPMPDPVSAARLFTETTFWFAVNRAYDPQPDPIDDELGRATVRTALLRTFLPCEDAP